MESAPIYREYLHAPSHLFVPNTAYMITAGTHRKEHIFTGQERLDFLQHFIFETAGKYGWELEAWSIFSNHYHLIAVPPDEPKNLPELLRTIHTQSAIWVNGLDHAKGRTVWYQYWDSCLTYPKSYFARLNYVHNNPVKHGLVTSADAYPWCSMSWFHQHAKPSFIRTLSSFKWDTIKMYDDF